MREQELQEVCVREIRMFARLTLSRCEGFFGNSRNGSRFLHKNYIFVIGNNYQTEQFDHPIQSCSGEGETLIEGYDYDPLP